MREHGMEIPREEVEKAEEKRQRAQLEERLAAHGDLEVDGVPDALKSKFAYEKQKEKEREIAKLWKEADAFEKMSRRYAQDERNETDFTDMEERWFAEGLKPEYVRRTALVEAWETGESLDVEDVPASEKASFAAERLSQLRDLQKTEKYRDSDKLKDRIRRLELLHDQYEKAAADEGDGDAAAA